MTYREALELNESPSGLDLEVLTNQELITLIDELPGWDYPLAEDMMEELASRAKIDTNAYFGDYGCVDDFPEDGLPHGFDFNNLFDDCVDRL